MKFYYLIFFFSFAVISGYAQQGADETDNYEENTYGYIHEITLPLEKENRSITDEQWNRLADDKAFNYMPVEQPKAQQRHYRDDGWWYRFFKGIFDFFTSVVGKVLLWCIISGIILFIIFRVIKLNGNILFSKKDKIVANDADESSDDYMPDDWEHTIQNAISAGNLRLAVRHGYRYLLSLLNERSLISYQSAKTNYQYANELAGTPYFQTFIQMTRQYEYAWYGGFEIQPQQFEDYYQHLKTIKEKLIY